MSRHRKAFAIAVGMLLLSWLGPTLPIWPRAFKDAIGYAHAASGSLATAHLGEGYGAALLGLVIGSLAVLFTIKKVEFATEPSEEWFQRIKAKYHDRDPELRATDLGEPGVFPGRR